jgi:hypothetical protein
LHPCILASFEFFHWFLHDADNWDSKDAKGAKAVPARPQYKMDVPISLSSRIRSVAVNP